MRKKYLGAAATLTLVFTLDFIAFNILPSHHTYGEGYSTLHVVATWITLGCLWVLPGAILTLLALAWMERP